MKLISKNEINKFIPVDLQQKYGLNKQRLAMFLAQVTHESNCLQSLEESFNYSATALVKNYPKYFDEELANKYGRTSKQAANQEMIANVMYANRMGNGDIESGEGYKYRGRGPIQITGKENYILLMMVLEIDCVERPELLTKLPYSLQSALWFWDQKKLNQYCPDIELVTKKINGGDKGLKERSALYQAYLTLLGAK